MDENLMEAKVNVINKSYLMNYYKTYLWRSISILLNLLSMFIVIPMITDNKVVYGIYSVCISTAIFLNYADLGFVSAGIKYAGESFAKQEVNKEIKYYGFSGFILFVFVAIIALAFLIFSFNPTLIIKDIEESIYLPVASKLLFIQAVFSFNTIFQRFVSGVFQVRIEQYIYQRINIVGSLIKISSVFYFFGQNKYDIVGYFVFIKVIELLILFIGVGIIQYKYNLSFITYLKNFRFSKSLFQKTKSLAFGSLFVTFMWILYFEIDLVVIGKVLGANAVAIYALAFTFLKFLRSLASTIFAPFQNRYNHFVGLNNINGLKSFVKKNVIFTAPIFIFPILSIIVLRYNIVITWAGSNFLQSGSVLLFLILHFVYSFINKPVTSLFSSLERIREMYKVSAIMVLVYWLGILLTIQYLDVVSFALFKFISGTVAVIFYLRFLLNFLEINLSAFFKNTVFHMIIPLIIQFLFLFIIKDFLPLEKSKINLLVVLIVGGIGVIIGFSTLFIFSKQYKKILVTKFQAIYKI